MLWSLTSLLISIVSFCTWNDLMRCYYYLLYIGNVSERCEMPIETEWVSNFHKFLLLDPIPGASGTAMKNIRCSAIWASLFCGHSGCFPFGVRKSGTTCIASNSDKADGFLEQLLSGCLWMFHVGVYWGGSWCLKAWVQVGLVWACFDLALQVGGLLGATDSKIQA